MIFEQRPKYPFKVSLKNPLTYRKPQLQSTESIQQQQLISFFPLSFPSHFLDKQFRYLLRLCLNLNFKKSQFLMQRQLTEFLLRLTFEKEEKLPQTEHLTPLLDQQCPLTSSQILNHIYTTINSEKNYKMERNHKLSLCSEETNTQSPQKCNCKKSKCLKLYCECFARGSFCVGCSCECCQNTKQFSEIRAKAIDEMLVKASIPFGSKSSSLKGCNCRKTGCQKKYCECFNQGLSCNEFCKCSNCENCRSQSS